MAGSREGGRKAAITNKKKYGEDFYRKNGKIGGSLGRGHKFAHGKVDPRIAGAKGGRKSRKTGPHFKPMTTQAEQTLEEILHYEKPENPLKRLFKRKRI